MDRLLGEARSGAQSLRLSEIASVVIEAVQFAERPLERYDLHAYAVMPNHVHLLVTPKVDVSKLLRSLKGFTARRANRLLGRAGQPFWQEESYDHWVRSEGEFDRIGRYIFFNPVRAGLVARPEDYPWSGLADLAVRPTIEKSASS
jgi:REP element-mobilizing transposase RayT